MRTHLTRCYVGVKCVGVTYYLLISLKNILLPIIYMCKKLSSFSSIILKPDFSALLGDVEHTCLKTCLCLVLLRTIKIGPTYFLIGRTSMTKCLCRRGLLMLFLLSASSYWSIVNTLRRITGCLGIKLGFGLLFPEPEGRPSVYKYKCI